MARERVTRWAWVLMAWMVLAAAALCNPVSSSAASCGDGIMDLAIVDDVVYSARLECPCASFDSRAAFRSCVRGVMEVALGLGHLPKRCRAAAMRYARNATCGAKTGKVACCKGEGDGAACNLVSSEARCEASRGGTGRVGSTESCYDACDPPPTPTPSPRMPTPAPDNGPGCVCQCAYDPSAGSSRPNGCASFHHCLVLSFVPAGQADCDALGDPPRRECTFHRAPVLWPAGAIRDVCLF